MGERRGRENRRLENQEGHLIVKGMCSDAGNNNNKNNNNILYRTTADSDGATERGNTTSKCVTRVCTDLLRVCYERWMFIKRLPSIPKAEKKIKTYNTE